MKFKRYPSIEQSYREKFIEIINNVLEERNIIDEFVVVEKVHGANASFYYDGTEMRVARRNDFLTKKEIKSDYRGREDAIIEKIKKMWNFVIKDYPNIEELVVIGERFGGHYPHKAIPKMNVSMIQAGVFYTPDIKFYGFDIKVNGKFLPIDHANFYFDLVKILRGKIMYIGPLEKCLEISPIFQSSIPGLLNLPEIDNNEAEGVVIRPFEEIYYGHDRIILKNKNPKFMERGNIKKPKRHVELSEYFQIIIENIRTYVCINRLNNVLSKNKELTNKDFGKLMKEFLIDVKEDFEKDYPDVLSTLEKKDLKIVMGPVNKEVSNLLKKEWLPKI